MNREEENHSHESYGQILFTRTTGTNRFYGSELQQDHYISMELKTSEVRRELSREWYFANKLLARIRMTAGQFAEMITSMNNGGGVCCTIEYLAGQKMQPLPEIENRKEFVHRKFEDRMKDFAGKLKKDQLRVKELTAKKTLSKADQQELRFLVEGLTTEVASNIPFFAKCFQETMDEVVLDAKTEIENAIQHKVNVLGLQALHDQNQLLSDGKMPNNQH